MTYRIVVTPEARDQLDAIYDYVAGAATPEIAIRFIEGLIDHLATLSDFPLIGTPRDDLRPGLRTLPHRRRVTIAFMVEDASVDDRLLLWRAGLRDAAARRVALT